jgi:hypothetical protein
LKGIQQIFHAVHNIFIDRSNNIWVSTDYGLKQFDAEKEFIPHGIYLMKRTLLRFPPIIFVVLNNMMTQHYLLQLVMPG